MSRHLPSVPSHTVTHTHMHKHQTKELGPSNSLKDGRATPGDSGAFSAHWYVAVAATAKRCAFSRLWRGRHVGNIWLAHWQRRAGPRWGGSAWPPWGYSRERLLGQLGISALRRDSENDPDASHFDPKASPGISLRGRSLQPYPLASLVLGAATSAGAVSDHIEERHEVRDNRGVLLCELLGTESD